MARTREDIIQQIDQQASQYPELNDLQDNDSKVSVWAYCKQVVAFVVCYVETLYDTLKKEIDTKIQATEIGTKPWYEAQAKKYQLGDTLSIVDNTFIYAKTDEAKQIVKYASITQTEQVASLLLKVAKHNYKPLTTGELNGFRQYMEHKKIIGTQIAIRSIEADKLEFNFTISLDPQLYDDGGIGKVAKDKPIENFIKTYLEGLKYDEPFYIGRMTDKLLDFAGVNDIENMQVHAHRSDGTTINHVGRKYESLAGVIRPATFGTENKQSTIIYQ